jgi:hypothetical protein
MVEDDSYDHIIKTQAILKTVFPGSSIVEDIFSHIFITRETWLERRRKLCNNKGIVCAIKNSRYASNSKQYLWSTQYTHEYYSKYWDHETGLGYKLEVDVKSFTLDAQPFCHCCGEPIQSSYARRICKCKK